jgi:anti-sigma regulatory factor (Ser/Thr protein kinase)
MGDPLSVPEDPAVGYGVAPEDAPEAPLASVAPFTPDDVEQEYDENHPPWPCLAWPYTDVYKVGTVPIAVRAARAHTRETFCSWGLPDGVIESATLVVSELVTNAIRASWPCDASQAITMWLSADHENVVVEVWDGSAERPRPRPGDGEGEGGRGLAIVAALSQSWGVYPDRHGKIVWAFLGADGLGGEVS